MSAVSPTSTTIKGDAPASGTEVTSIGVVGYLNTIPLTAGLERLAPLELRYDVPSAQVGMLESGEVDLALCSVIDMVHSSIPLQIVPAGMLGCKGKTMTVRLYSRVPFERIGRINCDQDSHTSVELLRILLRERHGIEPELVPFDARDSSGECDAILLIGDKVVTSTIPEDLQTHQLDLGEAWHDMTGQPFVFATWLCRADMPPEQLSRVRSTARILDRMRRRNAIRLPELATHHAARFNWPEDLARHYIVDLLRYELDEEAITGLKRFLEIAVGSVDSIRLLDWT